MYLNWIGSIFIYINMYIYIYINIYAAISTYIYMENVYIPYIYMLPFQTENKKWKPRKFSLIRLLCARHTNAYLFLSVRWQRNKQKLSVCKRTKRICPSMLFILLTFYFTNDRYQTLLLLLSAANFCYYRLLLTTASSLCDKLLDITLQLLLLLLCLYFCRNESFSIPMMKRWLQRIYQRGYVIIIHSFVVV